MTPEQGARWKDLKAVVREIDQRECAGYPFPEILTPDAAGEVHITFRRLTPGLAYGLRWISPDALSPKSPKSR